MKQYFFYKGKKRLGPFNAEQLKSLAANRTIGPETFLFTDSGEKKRAKQWLEQFADHSLPGSNTVFVEPSYISASFIQNESDSKDNPAPGKFSSSVPNGITVSSHQSDGTLPDKGDGCAYCTHCGHMVKSTAIMCPSCGFPPAEGQEFCRRCGSSHKRGQMLCLKCGASLDETETKQPNTKISDIDIGCLVIIIGFVFIVIIILSVCSDCIVTISEMLRSLFQ